jgi:NAD+ diphosphatase
VRSSLSFLPPTDPPLALSRHAHDRIGAQRVDREWLSQAWARDDTRVLLLHDGKVALSRPDGSPVEVSPSEAGRGERVLLGSVAGTAYFAVLLDQPPEGLELAGLRQIAMDLGDRTAGLIVHAVGLANWRRNYRFCPRCGGVLAMGQAGHVLECESCGRSTFPRTDPAVIMLVTDDDDRCLLGHATNSPRQRGFSTLAGFVEPGESLEHAVIREVGEEVGIDVDGVRYYGSQPWPLPASLMVGFFAHASTVEIIVDRDEISDARWFSREQLLAATTREEVVLPGHISIARRLIEAWYGAELPGAW